MGSLYIIKYIASLEYAAIDLMFLFYCKNPQKLWVF